MREFSEDRIEDDSYDSEGFLLPLNSIYSQKFSLQRKSVLRMRQYNLIDQILTNFTKHA